MVRWHADRQVKRNVRPEDSRKAREETSILIRKEKKNKRLKMRRETDVGASPTTQLTEALIHETIVKSMEILREWDLGRIVDICIVHGAVQEIRRLVGDHSNLSIEMVLNSGVLAYLEKALATVNDCPALQYECAWVMTNLSSSSPEHTKMVAEHPGVVHQLSRLAIRGPTAALRAQCAWCLGNVAAEEKQYRNAMLLQIDLAVDAFVHNIASPETSVLLEHFAWALSNILLDSQEIPLERTMAFVCPLKRQLDASTVEQEQLRSDICKCLLHLADEKPDQGSRVQVLLEFEVLPVLLKVLQQELKSSVPSRSVLVPLVRCIGLFAAGTFAQTDAVLELKFLDFVSGLVGVRSQSLLKETMWALSNIAAGTHEQAFLLAKRSGIMRHVVNAARCDSWMTRREGLWTLCHLLCNQDNLRTRAVVNSGAILPFSANLKIADIDLLEAILDGLDVMLTYDATLENGNMAYVLQEEGAIDQIENLLQHRSDAVYQKALKLIEDHFGAEPDIDEVDDQNTRPEANADSSLTFGTAKELFPENNTTVLNFERTIRD